MADDFEIRGRLRESADGLKGRKPTSADQQRRMREAMVKADAPRRTQSQRGEQEHEPSEYAD